jgi:hypothetical protein
MDCGAFELLRIAPAAEVNTMPCTRIRDEFADEVVAESLGFKVGRKTERRRDVFAQILYVEALDNDVGFGEFFCGAMIAHPDDVPRPVVHDRMQTAGCGGAVKGLG